MDIGKKVLAIIQARIGSTRLKSKVLLDICDKPLLWHVVNRIKSSLMIKDIVMAIPDTSSNNSLEKFAKENNLLYFRGDESDVLSRFYLAAKKYNGQEIVRLTADNPLIDPQLLDTAIEHHLYSQASYTYTSNYPLGINVEICNLISLEIAYREAVEDCEREHVTPYIYRHPELFKINVIQAAGKLRRPNLRLTVDTIEDLVLIREIYRRLYHNGLIFNLKDIIDLLDKYPELKSINAQIKQKELRN